jgi:hypothetical protein
MISITITWYLKHLACPPPLPNVKICIELVSSIHDYIITLRYNRKFTTLTILTINLICLKKKDTETSVGNTGTLYEEEGKLGPRQHLSHPILPKCFKNSKHNIKLIIL